MADETPKKQAKQLWGRRRSRPAQTGPNKDAAGSRRGVPGDSPPTNRKGPGGRVRRRKKPSLSAAKTAASGSGAGYCNPPKHTRFKPGQSGNPKGRPKGRKNFSTELQEELSERVTITEYGKTIKVSKQRALIKALVGRAGKGDPKAWDAIQSLLQKFQSQNEPHEPKETPLSTDEQAILDQLLGKLNLPVEENNGSGEDAEGLSDE